MNFIAKRNAKPTLLPKESIMVCFDEITPLSHNFWLHGALYKPVSDRFIGKRT